MKTRAIVAVLWSFLTLVVLAGCGPGKYVAKPNEEIYGTWANEKARPQKVVVDQTGSKWYEHSSDPDPYYVFGAAEVESKWKDAEGNIWYKRFSEMTVGIVKGWKFTELDTQQGSDGLGICLEKI